MRDHGRNNKAILRSSCDGVVAEEKGVKGGARGKGVPYGDVGDAIAM